MHSLATWIHCVLQFQSGTEYCYHGILRKTDTTRSIILLNEVSIYELSQIYKKYIKKISDKWMNQNIGNSEPVLMRGPVFFTNWQYYLILTATQIVTDKEFQVQIQNYHCDATLTIRRTFPAYSLSFTTLPLISLRRTKHQFTNEYVKNAIEYKNNYF